MRWIACFVVVLVGFFEVWPGASAMTRLPGPLGLAASVVMAFVVTGVSIGAVFLTDATFSAGWRLRIVIAILSGFAALVTLGVVANSLLLFMGSVFIETCFPYPLVAVPIVFWGNPWKGGANGLGRPRKVQAVTVSLITVALTVYGGLVFFHEYAPMNIVYRSQFQTGTEAIKRIDRYRQEYGRVPESLKELGFSKVDPDDLFYQKCGDHEYTICFELGFDDEMTYNQASRSWERRIIPCGGAENQK